MFEIESAGRLTLMRWRGALSMDELLRIIGDVRSGTAAAPVQVIACSDYRGAESFPEAALDAIVWSLLRQDNPHVACSVFLVDEDNVVLQGQLQTMLAQSEHEGRKLFTSVAALVAWLRPRVRPAELQKVQAFLEGASRPPSSQR